MGRILHIEDDEALVELFNKVIAPYGHHIDTALNGHDGLAFIKSNHYDIAVVDYCLPDMTGLDVCSELLTGNPEFPIIMITGKGTEKIMAEALRMGVSRYIQKGTLDIYIEIMPVIIKQLLSNSESLKQKKHSRRISKG